jgi:hypothetical protein
MSFSDDDDVHCHVVYCFSTMDLFGSSVQFENGLFGDNAREMWVNWHRTKKARMTLFTTDIEK